MSLQNHNAPVHSLHNSKSNRSLYTQNSQQSQQQLQRNKPITQQNYVQAKNQTNKIIQRQQQQVSNKINKLPNITQQKDGFKHQNISLNTKNFKQRQKDQMPALPNTRMMAPKIKDRYQNNDEVSPYPQNKSFNLKPIGGPQFNTIAVSLDRQQFKNAHAYNPMRMTGMSNMSGVNPNNINFTQNQRSRMLRSSQGGRWFRSQSLMQNNPIPQTRKLPTLEPLLHNFHKPNSQYYELLQQYINLYSKLQGKLKQKSDMFFKYHINLVDSVEQVKNKMQSYLQQKIDLSNLPIDRPDSDWGQQQLVKFYTAYHPILNQAEIQKLKIFMRERQNAQILLNQKQLDSEEIQKQQQKVVTILKKYKNCSYYGPIKDNKKHGFGYLHYFSGRFFQGLFYKDQKIKGFQMDDAQLYFGDYQKNQRHGEGIMKTNQYLLSGIFNAGQFKLEETNTQTANDTGFSKLANKNVFVSSTINQSYSSIVRKGFKIQFSSVAFYLGDSTSQIIQKYNSGDIYIGQINESSQKHGDGLQIFNNGDLYIGKYQQGVPEGYGQYYWDSGAFYRGDFLSGMRHGKGTWMMVNGDRYDGQYLNDKKNGKGTYVWKSGDKYQGQFQNDYRHGYGLMHWRDGKIYKGNWLNGIQANKSFHLQNSIQSSSKPYQSIVSKNSRLSQAKTLVLKKQQMNNKSIEKNTRNSKVNSKNGFHTIQQAVSLPANKIHNNSKSNSKKIPLQKLKAMLNPSNSLN